ncbi:MAG: nucleoside hydrolase [Calditrichales bacterium]|nr:MAG: nucleoside hydrolase [Calditrichales bacterium]
MNKIFFIAFIIALWLSPILGQDQRQKIILDCDLGGDIDDAFAVALVLASPEFEVMGIVLDHGLTSARARIACRMLQETGMGHIPVFVGEETLNVLGPMPEPTLYTNQFYWGEGFSDLQPQNMAADEFIIQTLKKFPGEVILITVGPLPNIGRVIMKDKNVLHLAKRIYAMFGSFYRGYDTGSPPDAEWNVRADIESAKRFSRGNYPVIYAGLDVTAESQLSAENMNKLLYRQSPLTNALCGLYTLWGGQTPTLHDVVAIGMLLWPELYTYEDIHFTVTDTGYTVINRQKAATSQIAVSIEMDIFFERIMARYLQQNLGIR